MSVLNQIKKRNDEIVAYDREKISNAISKAYHASLKERGIKLPLDYILKASNNLTDLIEKEIFIKFSNKIPSVEDIQDIVENVLIMNCDDPYVVKSYILYRGKHFEIRSDINSLIDIEKTMNGYLNDTDWRVRENASVNYSLGGLILHNSGSVTANYWLNKIYPKSVSDAHKNGDFHLHDLSMLSGYCAGWSLRQLIMEGLGGVDGKVASSPANHLSTLVNQMVNFIGILQNEWAGAQAFSSVDTLLAPFVWVDNLSYKEVKQCIQSLMFGLNTPSRWGSQCPFSNITLDWTPPNDLKDQPAIIGGQPIEKTYGEFQKEMDIINKAFLELFTEGDGNGRGFAYPIPTYNITEDFNWDNENAKLLFKMTGKYGTAYFQNFINSDLKPGDVRSMCCRLQLDKRELLKRGGGLFGANEFTGSIGVVTINMGRIGYLSKTEEEYFSNLSYFMEIAKESLEIKRKVIIKLTNQGLFPYTKRYLRHWNNHFSTIGLNGMNESMLNFMNKDLSKKEAIDFSIKVLTFMREKLVKFQEETGNLYNLEATPGEGTSYRLAKIDKKKYPDIILSGDTDPYYTNSTQLPVDHTEDIFEALELQNNIQKSYTGGTVFHAHLGESIDDPEVVKNLIKSIIYNYEIPYLTISPTYSICKNHGYIKGEIETCPTCGNKTEIYKRIVGYYRSINNFNKGKFEEQKERVTFKIPEEVIEQSDKNKVENVQILSEKEEDSIFYHPV